MKHSFNHPDKLKIILNILSLIIFTCINALATVWPYPGQSQYKSSKYEVKIIQNGVSQTSFVYQDANKNTASLSSMTNFNHWTTFSFNGTITIEITKTGGNIGTAEIRPLSRNYQPQINSNKLTFNISKPEKLWIKMEGMYEDPLFIFADEPEVNAPAGPSANVVYWGPGVHDVGKHYPLKANTTYYLAGGAYVKGSFLSDNNASNITVRGRGILSGENIPHCGYSQCVFDGVAIRFQGSSNTNLEVEGITVINPAQYCLQAYGGKLETHNVKFFGWWFETDGWVAGNGTSLYNSFFKVYDDVVKLYFDNLNIHDLVIYKQHNGAPFQLGWGSESGNDNLVENIDVIYDETNWNESGLSGNRGFINHANGNASGIVQRMTFRNISFDENISYLIGIKSQGTVKDFTLENIKVRGTQKFKSYFAGGNISGFSLKNVSINGQCITRDADINLQKSGTVGSVSYLGCGVVQGPQFDPQITFTNPAADATISGTYTLKTLAYDEDFGTTHGSGITNVFWQIFNINDPTTPLFSETISQAPFYWNLNTSNFPDGVYEFRAGVSSQDFTGRKWTSLKPVTIKNNTTPVIGKPNIWIHTDITGALSYTVNGNTAEAVTDAGSDPDDQVAMAMYLMMANKFNTRGIVLASTTRNTTSNTLTLFNQTLGAAYQKDLPCLNQNIGGYPTLAGLNVKESSLTAGTGYLSYSESPVNKYDNFADLPQTVKDLVLELGKSEYSAQNPLYVLIWGPMTEIAMATRHLIRNNKTTELERLFVVSHWTSSFFNQTGTPCSSFPADQIQFKPANCNQNCEACAFMHNEAKKTGAKFRFADLGSVGQTGIVNGSASYFTGGNGGVNGPQYQAFQQSALGDLFVKSKFGFGKPDGSDCATFITVLGDYGVKLSDFSNNGVLTQNHETLAKDKYLQTAQTLMQNLMNISNMAKSCVINTPEYIQTFTYPVAAGQAFASDKYDVYVKVGNGAEQKLQVLMSDVNYRTMYDGDWMKAENKDRTFSFVHLDYDTAGPQLTFRVVKKFGTNSSSAAISPKSYGYTPTLTSGKELTFKVNANNKYISVNFKGTDNESPTKGWIRNMLCIFIDQPETGKPVPGTAGVVKYTSNAAASALSNASVIYFPAGYHNLRNYANGGLIDADGALTLKSGQSIYLEGGAFVEGIIKRTAYGDVNQKIFGRGILTGRQYFWKNHPSFSGTEYGQLIELGNNAEVKGIMYMESPNHGVVGRSVHVENVKFLGWHSNHDGVRVGDGSEIHNSFFRAVDDHFYNFGIHVHDCVLWAGHNGSIMTYGWGGDVNSNNYAATGSVMENIDIINPEWTGLGNNNGLIMAQVGYNHPVNGTTTLRNIRMEGSIPGITNLKPRSSGATNTAVRVPTAEVTFLGDLILENITVEAQFTKGVIRGEADPDFDGSKKWLVKDVLLKNVSIGGVCINETNKNDYFTIDANTIQNVVFDCGTVTNSPSEITDLAATALSCKSVKLNWSDVKFETGYRVRRKTATTAYVVLADIAANSVTYTDTAAIENTAYTYMVRPLNGSVAAATSNEVVVSTGACPPPVIEPVISWVDLTAGQVLSGIEDLRTLAYDGNYGTTHGKGIQQIYYQIFDAGNLATPLDIYVATAAPYYWQLNTENYPNGNYQLRAGAFSLDSGEKKWAVINIKMQNIMQNIITGNTLAYGNHDFYLYPNPTHGKVHLSRAASWKLQNLSGEIILTGEGDYLDISFLPQGFYILKTETEVRHIIRN